MGSNPRDKILCTKQRFNLHTEYVFLFKFQSFSRLYILVSKCFLSSKLFAFSLLCLVHEGVEGVIQGVHEVGVVDWGLGAWKGRGVERKVPKIPHLLLLLMSKKGRNLDTGPRVFNLGNSTASNCLVGPKLCLRGCIIWP